MNCIECNDDIVGKRRGTKWCPVCYDIRKKTKQRETNQRFYLENREREKARAQTWRDENLERCKAITKVWRENNAERFAEMKRGWNSRNAEQISLRRQQRYQANREQELLLGKIYKENNKAELARKRSQYLKDHPEYNRYARSQRRAAEKQAIPAWADKKKIRAIYAMAVDISVETGIPHEVDHFYPLRSKVMCGLHVETNLQILTAEANRSKKNSQWLSQPCDEL